MRRSALLLPVFAALPLTLGAQEVRQQGTLMMLPAYTDSQRWHSAAANLTAVLVAGIAYAKSLGNSADDFGRFGGNLVSAAWGPANSGNALRYVRGLASNFAGYPGSDVQVTATSDSSASLRFRRSYYLPSFGATQKALGVTVDEYERGTRGILVAIAQYLGLCCTVRFEGEWATVAVQGRGSAAPLSAFPSGTYTAAFSDSIVNAHPNLSGAWEVTYMPNGHQVIRHDGALFIEGDYELSLDQISFPHPDTGPQGGCSTPATYRWVADPRTKAINFERLADDCAPRVEWATSVTLTKK